MQVLQILFVLHQLFGHIRFSQHAQTYPDQLHLMYGMSQISDDQLVVPVTESTSPTEYPRSCISRNVTSKPYVPMRLAMKFGVSFAITTPFPKRSSPNAS